MCTHISAYALVRDGIPTDKARNNYDRTSLRAPGLGPGRRSIAEMLDKNSTMFTIIALEKDFAKKCLEHPELAAV